MTEVVDSLGRKKITQAVPPGVITAFSGTTLPTGWLLCDGTKGTPDLTDRFVVASLTVATGSPNGPSGSVSPTLALTHSGAAVGAHSSHVVTQPSAHSNHTVTQPGAHSNHVVTQAAAHADHAANTTHTHDAHANAAAVAGSTTALSPTTHAANTTHTHDSHDAHTGGALDAHSAHSGFAVNAHSAHSGWGVDAHSAHSVTQTSDHAIIKHYKLAFLMKA